MKRIVALAIVVVIVSVAAQAALAGSSTVLGSYGSNGAKPVLKVKGGQAHAQQGVKGAVSSGKLPFTGIDLTVVSIAGIALLGLGFGLRRLGRERS